MAGQCELPLGARSALLAGDIDDYFADDPSGLHVAERSGYILEGIDGVHVGGDAPLAEQIEHFTAVLGYYPG